MELGLRLGHGSVGNEGESIPIYNIEKVQNKFKCVVCFWMFTTLSLMFNIESL